MVTLSMHTTTDASSFSSDEWAAWDAFLVSSGEPSLHLSSGAVRASLRSPHRAVRVAVWRNDLDVLVGIAVCEDSEAISQSVDDFLEGSDVCTGQGVAPPTRRTAVCCAGHWFAAGERAPWREICAWGR